MRAGPQHATRVSSMVHRSPAASSQSSPKSFAMLGHVRKFTTTISTMAHWDMDPLATLWIWCDTCAERCWETRRITVRIWKLCESHRRTEKGLCPLMTATIPEILSIHQMKHTPRIASLQRSKGLKATSFIIKDRHALMFWGFVKPDSPLLTARSSDKTDTIQHGIAAPMFYGNLRHHCFAPSSPTLVVSNWVVLRSGEVQTVQNCRTQTEHRFQVFVPKTWWATGNSRRENRKPPWIDQCMKTLCC